MGNRHHFVPQFYLRAFSQDGRRLNLFNIAREQLILNASLRDQCYAHRLYGANDEIENALSQIEGGAALAFSSIRDRRVLPGAGTSERLLLTIFLGLQLARTTAAQANALAMSQLMTRVAFDGAVPDEYKLTDHQAMMMMLHSGPLLAATIRDLGATLILASDGASFLTSDNPVFKYNVYCEGITDFGVTGTKSRGLQIFFPVSPNQLLYLFDPAVYKLVRTRDRLVAATAADMEQLNRLQLVSARRNVYLSNAGMHHWISETVKSIQAIRDADRPRLTVAVEAGNDRSELLHQYWPMPQLGLTLSFTTIRPNARQVPLFERARKVRTPYSEERPGSEQGGTSRRFDVSAHHQG